MASLFWWASSLDTWQWGKSPPKSAWFSRPWGIIVCVESDWSRCFAAHCLCCAGNFVDNIQADKALISCKGDTSSPGGKSDIGLGGSPASDDASSEP